jgi:DNA-binding CsgD family transcriptional regulator/tetratricopeptide (TPR) repeat protein
MLIERDEPLRLLNDALERSINARGEILLVSGEAGIGKTALLKHFMDGLPVGVGSAWGACDALFTPRPLGPLMDMADSLGPECQSLIRGGAQASDLFIGLIDTVERRAGGFVLVFEDAHWADNATLDLLKFLCRRIMALQCLVIISYRSDEVGPDHPLTMLIGDLPSRVVSRLELSGLSVDGIERLAEQYQRSDGGIYALTGGNPFFATELLSSPTNKNQDFPLSIQAAVSTRLAKLKPDEQQLIAALATIPHSVDTQLLDVIDKDFGNVLSAACLSCGVVEEASDGTVSFRHDLARHAVLSMLTRKQLRMLNLRMLNILMRTGLDMHYCELAAHFSTSSGDASAILTYAPLAAARAARLGAHQEATKHLANALRFVEAALPEVAAQLLEDWAYEAGIADSITPDVLAAREQAISLWRAANRMDRVGHNYRWLWRLHWYRGETEKAAHAEKIAFDTLESIAPSAELAMAYSTRSQIHFLNGRSDEAVVWGERAVALAKQFNDVPTQVHAMTNIGSALLFRNDLGGKPYMEASLALARQHHLHEHAARVFTNYAEFAILARDFPLAEQLVLEGIAFDTRLTLDSWTYYLVGRQAQLRLDQGRLRDAETIAVGVLAVDKLTIVMRMPALFVLAITRARMGLPDADELLHDALEKACALEEPQNIVPVKLALIEHAYLQGRHDAAELECAKVAALGVDLLQPWHRNALALWMHRLTLSFDCPVVPDPGSPAALEISGDAIGAASVWHEQGVPFEAALSRLHANGPGRPVELARAISELEAIGADAAAAYGRHQALAMGIVHEAPRRRRGPYRAARSHPLGLTAREVEILQLIVEGVSNREIAQHVSRSQRTIEHHVSAILMKLSAANRMQAALRAISEPWILENMP